MKNLNSIVAKNLSRIRQVNNLSYERVHKMTGVSKSMLAQIEKEESTPSITTVWKIANGLKISFSDLINEQQLPNYIVDKDDINPLIEDEGRYRLYPFFPFEGDRKVEIFSGEIDKNGSLKSDGHIRGTEEFITVFDGELIIMVGNDEYKIKKGSSMKFIADKPHSYTNKSEEQVRFSMVIYYTGYIEPNK